LFHRSDLPPTSINVAVISGGNIEQRLLQKIKQEATPAASY